MVLGHLEGMPSKYMIRSNREAGDGRFDLMLEPKESALPAIIMEFKASKSADEARLREMAEVGLKQINYKHYGSELYECGISHIVKYGIAFFEKRVEVAYEESTT